jgi:hypothetical protein
VDQEAKQSKTNEYQLQSITIEGQAAIAVTAIVIALMSIRRR